MSAVGIDKYRGCFLGLAIGDAFGAPYEGGILERSLWKLIGFQNGRRRYTDDTQMSMDVANSILTVGGIEQQHLAETFAGSYRWSRGYGPSAGKLLKGIRSGKSWQELNRRKFKDGSMGNGAAMRAPVVALYHPYHDEQLFDYVKKSAEITHAHPLAIEGAHLIAVATIQALNNATSSEVIKGLANACISAKYQEKIRTVANLCEGEEDAGTKVIRKKLGNGMLALESCPAALYFALKHREKGLNEMLSKVFALGGDTDTIGAMASAIWGAYNGTGQMAELTQQLENSEIIVDIAEKLYQMRPQLE